MRIHLASAYVDDQDKALRFYTEVLGFIKKTEIPLGEARWLTVVSPEDPNGTELLLEPDGHPVVRPFKDALGRDGIPSTSFALDDVHKEFERLLALGVEFTQEPAEMGLFAPRLPRGYEAPPTPCSAGATQAAAAGLASASAERPRF